jgi:transcriptional regulator GlxA family with amidase domain
MLYRIAPLESSEADIITVRIRSRAFNPAASGDRDIRDLLWQLSRQSNIAGPLVPGLEGARNAIRSAAVRLADETMRDAWGLAVRLKARAMDLLAEIGDSATRHLSPSPVNRSDRAIREALWILDEQFDQPMSAWSLARGVGLSRSHFHKAFREYTGRTFTEHLASLRIARACRLLEDPSAEIAAVAMRCGYESLSQFYAMFKRIMGVPPGRYRRRERE